MPPSSLLIAGYGVVYRFGDRAHISALPQSTLTSTFLAAKSMFTSTTFQGATNSRACSKNFVSFMPEYFCHICAENHTLWFCVRLTERGTSEEADERNMWLPLQRVAKPEQERNGIDGGDPRSGEEAVYAGFDLERA